MAEPEGKVLNIDDALAKRPRNVIAKIGVELEGCWKKLPPGIGALTHDSSVFNDKPPSGYVSGELPLGPMVLAFMNRAIKKHYPDLVDATCGLHVHMGLETTYQYNLLADSPDYQETIVEYLKRWAQEERLPNDHPIWERFEGKSIYCQKKFWPYDQMINNRKDYDKNRHGHRYTMIHYCWGRYETVECRLLPMMTTAEQAQRVVKRVVDITNAYIVTVDKRKVKESGRIELDNGDIYEEYLEVKL